LGAAATHDGPDHDFALDRTFSFRARSIRLIGGSTKCGRVLFRHLEHRPDVAGVRALELGAGAGIVTHGLALGGADVWATDQAPMIEGLEENLDRNLDGPERARVRVMSLYWGDEDDIRAALSATTPGLDLVVGADLIFARENILPLVATVAALCTGETRFLLSYTRRFLWEETFFQEMDRFFVEDWTQNDGDVTLVQYRRFPPPSD
jgi:predicted nicotinamide N-methyase